MPQDAFTLSRLTNELNDTFRGGKINKIVAPTSDEIVFTIYTGKGTKTLYISVNPGCPRISIERCDKQSPLTASNFCMLLRKHLSSAKIDEFSLVGFDRIVKIKLTASDEFFDAKEKTLFVELMGRYSNVILTENGKVLGGNRGINSFDNGVRPLIVNKPYLLPPTNEKLLPTDTNLIDIFAGEKSENIAQIISSKIQGISNLTAEEIAYKFTQKHGEFSGEKSKQLFEFINDFLFNVKANACVYIKGGKPFDVCVFPYEKIAENYQTFATLLEAENYYFLEREKVKTFDALLTRLRGVIDAQIKKAKKRLFAILSREKDAENCDRDNLFGELILTNIYKLKGGEDKLIATSFYDEKEYEIPLDKALSPSKNAERYYKKYAKKKRTLEALVVQKEQALNEVEYLQNLSDFISICKTTEELVFIKEELEQEGLIKKIENKRKTTQKQELKEYEINGYTIRVGRNNLENEKVTFSAKPSDVWLHAKDYASSHVVVQSKGGEIPKEILFTASEICAYYSKGREAGKVEVVYTLKKNVKKPTGAKRGKVTYVDYNSLVVLPKNHAEILKTSDNA